MDDRQVRREYESIKRFVAAAVARGKIDYEAVMKRYDAGESSYDTGSQILFHEGMAMGFKRCAELILGFIEDGEKAVESAKEDVSC